MKVALLASDPLVLPLLELFQAGGEIEISQIYAEPATLRSEVQTCLPAAKLLDGWDDCLTNESLDAVLLCGGADWLQTAGQQLVHAGKTVAVLILPQRDPRPLFAYTATWQEGMQRLFPVFLSDLLPLVEPLRDVFQSAQLGRLWKVSFERVVTETSPDLLEQSSGWFLTDLCWLKRLHVDPKLVTMQRTGPRVEDPTEISIRLHNEDQQGGEASPEHRLESDWSLCRGSVAGWTLRLHGEQGTVVVQESETKALTVQLEHGESLADACAPSAERLGEQLTHQLQRMIGESPQHTWTDVIKHGEYGATARRSLTRRRTLPVHFEEASERSQFKSQMAAIGCGVLVWTMFAMIGLLVIGAACDPRDREYLLSSSARYVLREGDFQNPDSSKFSQRGEERLRGIRQNWSSTSPVLIIEAPRRIDPAELTEESAEVLFYVRWQRVVEFLRTNQIRDPEDRIVLRPLPGQWFETAMLLGWVVVFLPLGLVLVAQLFFFVSRPMQ